MSYVHELQHLTHDWLAGHPQWRSVLQRFLPWLGEILLLIVACALALVIVLTHPTPTDMEIAVIKLGFDVDDAAQMVQPTPSLGEPRPHSFRP